MSKSFSLFLLAVAVMIATTIVSALQHHEKARKLATVPPPYPSSSSVQVSFSEENRLCSSSSGNQQQQYETETCIDKAIGFSSSSVIFRCAIKSDFCISATGYSSSTCDSTSMVSSLTAPCSTCAGSDSTANIRYACDALPAGMLMYSCSGNSGCQNNCNSTEGPFNQCNALKGGVAGDNVTTNVILHGNMWCRSITIEEYFPGSACSQRALKTTYALASGECFDGLRVTCA